MLMFCYGRLGISQFNWAQRHLRLDVDFAIAAVQNNPEVRPQQWGEAVDVLSKFSTNDRFILPETNTPAKKKWLEDDFPFWGV